MKQLAYRLPIAFLTFLIGTFTASLWPRTDVTDVRPVGVITKWRQERPIVRCEDSPARRPGNESQSGYHESAYAQNMYGDELRHAGCFKEAVAAYELAISDSPSFIHAYNDLANTCNHLTWYAETIKYARRGLKVNPDEAYLWNELGFAYASQRRYEEAAEAYRRTIQAEPENAFAHASLSEAYFKLKQFDRALAAAEQGGKLGARFDDDASINNAGATLLNLNRYEQALDFFHQSASISPAEIANQMRLATTYSLLGRHDEARAAFRRTLSLRPTAPNEYLRRGWASLYLGEPYEASAAARDYLERTNWKGQQAPYAALLAYIADKQIGRDANATLVIEEAAEKCDPDLWEQNLLRYLRRELTAARLLSSATNDEERTGAHLIIGLELLFQKKTGEAIPHLTWVRENGDKSDISYPYLMRQLYKPSMECGTGAS
jgi:tetratricopeptide (TPR) repeat protein